MSATAFAPRWSFRPGRRTSGGQAAWFIGPAALVPLVVYLGTMLYALQASFTLWVLVEPSSEEDPAGLSNYADVLRSCVFWEAVRVTVTSAASSIACGLVLGTAMALALNLDFYGRTIFRSAMMIPMVITPSVIGIFWKLLYEQESGVFNAALQAVGLPGACRPIRPVSRPAAFPEVDAPGRHARTG